MVKIILREAAAVAPMELSLSECRTVISVALCDRTCVFSRASRYVIRVFRNSEVSAPLFFRRGNASSSGIRDNHMSTSM